MIFLEQIEPYVMNFFRGWLQPKAFNMDPMGIPSSLRSE